MLLQVTPNEMCRRISFRLSVFPMAQIATDERYTFSGLSVIRSGSESCRLLGLGYVLLHPKETNPRPAVRRLGYPTSYCCDSGYVKTRGIESDRCHPPLGGVWWVGKRIVTTASDIRTCGDFFRFPIDGPLLRAGNESHQTRNGGDKSAGISVILLRRGEVWLRFGVGTWSLQMGGRGLFHWFFQDFRRWCRLQGRTR